MTDHVFRVAIVDDEHLARERLRHLVAVTPGLVLVGEYADARRAVAGLSATPADILLLDIEMPHVDGFGVVRAIERQPGVSGAPAVVFVTAYRRYAVDAFNASAVDYLLKPFDRARFHAAIDRAARRILGTRQSVLASQSFQRAVGDAEGAEDPESSSASEPCLYVRSARDIIVVKASDLESLHGDGNYVRLHTTSGRYLIRQTLQSLEARFGTQRFVRVHRSAMVNLNHVVRVRVATSGNSGACIMRSGAQVRVSRTYLRELRQRTRVQVAL